MSNLHYKKICWSCGKVVEQCRCADLNKTQILVQCDECKAKTISPTAPADVPSDTPPAGILHNPCMCPECRKKSTDRDIVYRFNTLIGDLLSRLPPEVGTDVAGGTRIGKDIYLPNGGTWRRIQ